MTSLDFRLKKIDKTRIYLLEEIKHNELMSEKHKKVYRALNYFEHFLVFIFVVSGCASTSALPSLDCLPEGIASFAVRLKICAIISLIKKYQSIIRK